MAAGGLGDGRDREGISSRSGQARGAGPRGVPHSLEAERVVLGCMLLDPGDVLPRCVDRLTPEHFYDARHQIIFEQMRDMFHHGVAVDVVTLADRLRTAELLDRAGGPVAISELAEGVPTTAHAEHYLNIVRDEYILRRLLHASESIAQRARGEEDVETLLDEAEREIFEISEHRVRDDELAIGQALHDAMEKIERLAESKSGVTGLGTGFADLDLMTSGFHEGEMIVLAARPSMGKTAFAMNVVEHVALEEGRPVGVFSLEMSREQLVMRMLCSMTARGRQGGVSLGRVRTGMLSQEDHRAIVSQASDLMKAPIYVDDAANLNILQLRAKSRRMRSQYRVELIVVDYLQLLQGFVRRKESRQQEIAEISGGIKALSKELGVPVLVLSQLNREVERRDDHKPRLADLRESGSIEQDADVVALLVRPGVYDDGQDRDPSEAVLVIAKQRNGPTGEVELRFRGEYARFDSVMRGHLPEPEEVFS